jgi:hypothetical protein
MPGLCQENPCWDTARSGGDGARVFEDAGILLATDFEGGNGADWRALGPDHYSMRLEPEPGEHLYSGKQYYFCFGARNRRPTRRTVRIRLAAYGWGFWAAQTQHVVLRRGGKWSQLNPAAIRPVEEMVDTVEVDLDLPGVDEPEATLYASNFHWWPYSEMVEYLRAREGLRSQEIARSFQGRAIYAVEIGNDAPGAPCMVHTQTPQPSEMGSLACRAMIDFLTSGAPEAAAIRERFRVCFIPMTNPDGTVLGYGISDAQGRFPFFEGHLAASGDSSATPETQAVWRYLEERRPWLFWEWHSNNWSRRPGHMLLRYRPELASDPRLRGIWERIDAALLALPDTHHGNWTSHTEGSYRSSMGFQAITRLGAVSCMIKHHDKFPLEQSRNHAIACLQAAAAAYIESEKWKVKSGK